MYIMNMQGVIGESSDDCLGVREKEKEEKGATDASKSGCVGARSRGFMQLWLHGYITTTYYY